jgi:hypothetical protein
MKILKPMLVFILLSSWSLAHSPRMVIEGVHLSVNTAYKIPDAEISWALYAKLPSKSIEWYSFELKTGQTLYVSMTVPQIAGLEDFAPSFAIIGQGLIASKLEPMPSGMKAVPVPSNMGALVVPPSTPRLEVHGGHGYWIRQNASIKAPLAGKYFVAVFHGASKAGKYVLAPGQNEVFVNEGRASSAEINAYFAKP